MSAFHFARVSALTWSNVRPSASLANASSAPSGETVEIATRTSSVPPFGMSNASTARSPAPSNGFTGMRRTTENGRSKRAE